MRLTTLADLGAETLPTATHSTPYSGRWFPVTSLPPPVAPVTAIDATPVADGVLLEWEAVESGGAVVVYLVERSVAPTGPWTEVARTTETRYLYSDGSGQTWYFRITPTVRGQAGPSEVIEGAPDAVTARLVEIQTKADQAVAEAARAELAAADALLLMGTAYSGQAEYAAGDVVHIDGRMYRAAKQVPLETPPPAPAYWTDIGTVTEAQGGTMSAVQQLRVDTDGNGSEIAALTQRVGNSEVGITQLLQVSQSSAIDIVRNGVADAARGRGLWGANAVVIASGAHPTGQMFRISNGGAHEGGFANSVDCAPGDVFDVQCDTNGFLLAAGDWSALGIAFYDINGQSLGTQAIAGTNLVAGTGWVYGVKGVSVPAPANTVRCCAVMFCSTSTSGSYGCFNNIRMRKRSALDAAVAARHTVALDVNGLVSGTTNENDGKRSSFSILATVFRVISNITGMGMEWQDGYLRIWKSAAQLILGHTFGSGDLVMWYGPNVGVSNCSKSNATFWLDISGGAYFGGSLAAGVLKNAVQSTSLATVGLELINGPFSTNGRVRNVVVSYARSHRRTRNAFGSDGFVAGAGANSGKVRVYRKIGSGAETLWQTIDITGGVDIRNEWDGPDTAVSFWGGSVTVNDTSPATDVVQYRAELVDFKEQSVTHQGGGFNSQAITQNLSIVSVES